MSVERWERTKELLEEAVGLPCEKRRAYLDSACGQDEELRAEVESLIAAHEEAGSQFLAAPAAEIHDLTSSLLVPNPTLNQMIGHYRVVEEIGRGGMGVVYQAEDIRLGRCVAMKFLPGELASDRASLERLQREARAASALDHPNICSIYELGEHEGQPFIVMQLLEGQTLREWIESAPKLDMRSRLSRTLDFAIQIADGLDAAHRKGIVHRDIKPANIFITTRGDAKILDFGLAKVVDGQPVPDLQGASGMVDAAASTADAGKPHLTRTGTTAGTPCYMSPEQVLREGLDARTDLFSLGLVLYEMVTGQRAFAGETWAEVKEAILQQAPVPVRQMNPAVPVELERIINKALEKDRTHRYQSAQDALRDLLQLREAFGQAVSVRKRKLVLVAGTLLTAIGATAGGIYYRGHRSKLLTNKDTIVVSDFTNTTGDAVFDDTLRQGLSVQLEQSPFLSMIPDSKVNQTLKLMGRPAGDRLTPEVTREICQRTSSKAMFTGSIAALGSHYVIGLKAVNCQSGDVLAETQQQAKSKEGVLNALDTAAVSLRSRLGESLSTVQEYATPLSDETTSSLEALKALSLGRKTRSAKGDTAALPFFKRAVELDSNFAEAYLDLSASYDNLNEAGLSAEYARKAYELREKVSERERFSIEAFYYWDVTGELEKALQTYELWQQTYPRNYVTYQNLGVISGALGSYERQLEEFREALRLEPNNVVNYSNLGSAYQALNRLDEAEGVYKQAEERRLEGELLFVNRYILAFLKGDAAQMQRFASAAMGKLGTEDLLLALQADTQAWYGKLKNARELTRRAMDSAEHNDAKETAASYQAESALREVGIGNHEVARAEANAALNLASNRDVKAMAALALARAGDTAGAEKLAAELDKTFPLDTLVQRYWLPTIRAAVAMEREDPNRDVELLKETGAIELGSVNSLVYLAPIYVRGEAYLALGDGNQAATEFQKFVDHRGVVGNFSWGALAHLQVGRAYAMQGDTAKARAAYEEFLTLWKDADPDVPILKQAKAEYAKLR